MKRTDGDQLVQDGNDCLAIWLLLHDDGLVELPEEPCRLDGVGAAELDVLGRLGTSARAGGFGRAFPSRLGCVLASHNGFLSLLCGGLESVADLAGGVCGSGAQPQ